MAANDNGHHGHKPPVAPSFRPGTTSPVNRLPEQRAAHQQTDNADPTPTASQIDGAASPSDSISNAPAADIAAIPAQRGPRQQLSREEIDTLVTENLALVGHLAREAAARMPRHLDAEDLVGAGALALVQAAHSYDPQYGVPFGRFASARVRGAMIDHMRQRDWATRSVRSRARKVAEALAELSTALGREPTEDELATATGLSCKEIRSASAGTERARLLSLDMVRDDGSTLTETVVDPAPAPDDTLIMAEKMGYLRDAVAELPERLRIVVTGYYLDNRPLTEIAHELDITQSRASQLRAEGLELLHRALTLLLAEEPSAPGCAQRGARDRRQDAYVAAVAARSSAADRADVRWELRSSSPFDAAPGHAVPPRPAHPRSARTGSDHPRSPRGSKPRFHD